SIGETAQLIAELMNVKINIGRDEVRIRPEASEVFRLLASNDKARRLLDWQPRNSGAEGLRNGMQTTIDWFMNPDNQRRYKADTYNI
ncbi:NAD-dependent dehydratase, partial [Acinetobacter baumannii]